WATAVWLRLPWRWRSAGHTRWSQARLISCRSLPVVARFGDRLRRLANARRPDRRGARLLRRRHGASGCAPGVHAIGGFYLASADRSWRHGFARGQRVGAGPEEHLTSITCP